MTIFAAATASVLLCTAVVYRRQSAPATLLLACAALLAGAFAIQPPTGGYDLRLGPGRILALFFWVVLLVHLLLRERLHLRGLDKTVWLAAAVALPLGLLWPSASGTGATTLSIALRVHIFLSLAAWAVLSLAALQAIACAMQIRRLRGHNPPRFDTPLLQLEQSCFRMIGIGWLLLVGGIGSGFLFVEDFLGQHLAHKAVFTILAAVLFGVLLAGQALRGWRGARALRWILAAWLSLFVGYAGVKIILEYGLARTWT